MKIAFLGTPEFAVPSLHMLIRSGHTLCVFTQPDKPQGRHAKLTPPPVKTEALCHCIPVRQPARIRSEEGVAMLREFAPDLMVTAAFGQILSAENLSIPPHGCINVHGSLLPQYRGAAPIQWAVIGGEKTTGITTMYTSLGLDTGDILLQREIDILPNETAGELYPRMAELGAQVLEETIARLTDGTLTRTPQDEARATKCSMLNKEDGKLDFYKSAQEVHDRVRGVNPWPGAYGMMGLEPFKIWRTRVADVPLPQGAEPGECFGDAKCGLFIACGDGRAIEVLEVQIPSCKRMQSKACMCGRRIAGLVLT